jgi:hypothetical protein
MQARRGGVKIRVDGTVWFKGKASSVLFGNVGKIFGGLEVFPAASPTDGMLEVGVVTAKSAWQWLRVFSRVAVGHLDRSPFIQTTKGKKIVVELDHKTPYELDGGARGSTTRLKVRVEAGAVDVCVPARAATERATKRPTKHPTKHPTKRAPRKTGSPRRSRPALATQNEAPDGAPAVGAGEERAPAAVDGASLS